jgi:hypothetical protein
MIKHAWISPCGYYRWELVRTWASGKPTLLYVMLNPSTADDTKDDATLRRCLSFADRHGYGSIRVVNLFAFRATSPAVMRRAEDPVGEKCDEVIRRNVRRTDDVCLAWGALAGRVAKRRAEAVLKMLRRTLAELKEYTDNADGAVPREIPRLLCLGTTLSGQPVHPVRQPGSARLIPFRG